MTSIVTIDSVLENVYLGAMRQQLGREDVELVRFDGQLSRVTPDRAFHQWVFRVDGHYAVLELSQQQLYGGSGGAGAFARLLDAEMIVVTRALGKQLHPEPFDNVDRP